MPNVCRGKFEEIENFPHIKNKNRRSKAYQCNDCGRIEFSIDGDRIKAMSGFGHYELDLERKN